jgi:MoaA/NifB/PqqE/SkfB family radical SAM enzyme
MCARNIHGGKDNPLITISDITLEEIKKFLPVEFIKQLKSIPLCGNFGDPLLNKDMLDIVDYIAQANPAIRMDIHTNGSLRSRAWWSKLAVVAPKDHCVQFGIDGLSDTHSIYRIGTNFEKIIESARAFILAGGKARWNFITFKHNEHQIEEARQMAKDLGFESFQEKQTSRFIGNPWFDVHDRNGNTIYRLENVTEQRLVFIDKKTVESYKELVKGSKIDCEVEKTKQVYIDAQGYLWPCCFVGGTKDHYSTPDQIVHNYRLDSLDSLNRTLDRFGGIEQFNLRHRTIKEIVDSEAWQTIWNDTFENDKMPVCARTCGKWNQQLISQCRDQFLDLEEFDE